MEQIQTNSSMHFQPQLERAGGIDVHEEKIVAYSHLRDQENKIKDYGTFTCDLEQIRDDLLQENIQDVIMESTGIYWIALCTLLMAAEIRVTVVNPRFVKNMPK